MGDKMIRMVDTPDSVDCVESTQNSEPMQSAEPTRETICAQDGDFLKVKTVKANVKMESSSDGTERNFDNLPKEMPKGVKTLYINKANVLEADTIDGDIEMKHTVGKPSK